MSAYRIVKRKESKKLEKYLDLTRELKNQRNMNVP